MPNGIGLRADGSCGLGPWADRGTEGFDLTPALSASERGRLMSAACRRGKRDQGRPLDQRVTRCDAEWHRFEAGWFMGLGTKVDP